MITEEYKAQMQQMHRDLPHYGVNSAQGGAGRLSDVVWGFCLAYETTDVLDYGCGKGQLSLHLPFNIQLYDPGMPEYDTPPKPADVVVCTDVLEHVEPDEIEKVLDDIARCTKKVAYLQICQVPASKTLPDGRNAHILLRDSPWWKEKLEQRFRILDSEQQEKNLIVMVGPKND